MEVFDPQDSERNQPQGAVALGALVVAGGQAAVLLAASDPVLHPVAPAVDRAVERAGPALIAPPRDGVPAAAPPTVGAPDTASIALVASYPPRADAGAAPAGTPDPALLQQPLEHRGLMLLPRREHDRQGLAAPLGAEMDLGGEAALTAPERLGLGVPPFAPAACWCARTTVPSTQCSAQSKAPAASACRWTAANSRSQTPARVQRRKRVYTVCHRPYRS